MTFFVALANSVFLKRKVSKNCKIFTLKKSGFTVHRIIIDWPNTKILLAPLSDIVRMPRKHKKIMASIPNVGPPVAKNLTDSAKKRFRREQNKAEIFKTKATSTKELRLTHAGLDKILLDRFDLFFFLSN